MVKTSDAYRTQEFQSHSLRIGDCCLIYDNATEDDESGCGILIIYHGNGSPTYEPIKMQMINYMG